jgi:aminopeptidase N
MATVRIMAEPELDVIFNGALAARREEGRRVIHEYRTYSPTHPTVIAGEFSLAEAAISDTARISFHHQPGYCEVAREAVEHAVRVHECLTRLLGIDPVGNFQLVQLKRNDFGEYAPFPMVTMPLHCISTAMGKEDWQSFDAGLGHEMGHFWFGHLVQSSPNEQWLSEGFASYLDLAVTEALYGTEPAQKKLQRCVEMLSQAPPEEQAALYDIPLRHPHQGMLVRVKGALVLQCLRQQTGDEAFGDFLRELLRRHQGEHITTGTVEHLCAELFPRLDARGFFGLHLKGTAEYCWDGAEREVRVEG